MKNIISKIIAFFKSFIDKIFKKTKRKAEIKESEQPKLMAFQDLSNDDITKIKNIIRPLIKELNYNEMYIKLCEDKGLYQRVLKTFSKVSYGNFLLIISFTQNKEFNIAIESIITGTWFMDKFKKSLEVMDSEFYITIHDGSILIRKVFS